MLRPNALGAAVLNDIGPVIEREGLARIVAYVGRVPLPADWKEATELVHEMNRRQFTAIPAEEWADIARQVFNDDNGLPASAYDPQLAKAISMMDGPTPELWPQFAALTHVPVLAIRGENSDILSPKTLAEMSARHPRAGHVQRARPGPRAAAQGRADHQRHCRLSRTHGRRGLRIGAGGGVRRVAAGGRHNSSPCVRARAT